MLYTFIQFTGGKFVCNEVANEGHTFCRADDQDFIFITSFVFLFLSSVAFLVSVTF